MRKILVPLDGSRSAELGLRAATRVAAETGGELLLLWAVPFQGAAHGEKRESEQTAIRATVTYLEVLRESLAAQGLAARSLVLPGDAARAILFAAEVEDVDLISMATHGHGGMLDRLLGSVTAAVPRATDRSLLIARAADECREWHGVVSCPSGMSKTGLRAFGNQGAQRANRRSRIVRTGGRAAAHAFRNFITRCWL
jgi:nucleotide-binding universal stress UspA family protein